MPKTRFVLIHDRGCQNYKFDQLGSKSSGVICFPLMFEGDLYDFRNVSPEFLDENYDFYMLWLISEPSKFDKFLQLLKGCKKAKSIVFIDSPAGWQQNPLPLIHKKQFMDICSLANYRFCYANEKETKSYFEFISRGKKVWFTEYPYPFKIVQKYAKKERKFLVLLPKGLYNYMDERNAICNFAVFDNLLKKYSKIRAILYSNHIITDKPQPYSASYCELFQKEMAGILQEYAIVPWESYLDNISRAYLSVNLDCLRTRGQFALESAALGIPCICSGSVAGERLFPQTFVKNYFDIDKATGLAIRLIENRDFYIKVVAKAYSELENYYSFPVMKKKIFNILGLETD